MTDFNPKKLHRAECGAVLLFMAISISVLLLLVGLGIDAGNVYRSRVALQNAADAAALAGIGFTTQLGRVDFDAAVRAAEGNWTNQNQRDDKINDFLRDRTEQIAFSMLADAGLGDGTGRHNVEVLTEFETPNPLTSPETAYTYRVELRREVDFLVLDAIPGFGRSGRMRVDTAARADRKPGIIAIVFDISDSMNCPAVGSCDCMFTPGQTCPAGNTKMDQLIEALREFIRMFDVNRDRLYLVPFNIRGRVFALGDYVAQYPILGRLEDLDEAKIDQMIAFARAEFQPKSSTNLTDALYRLRQRWEEDDLLDDEKAIVVFTDGGLTGGRFMLANPKPSPNMPVWDTRAGGLYDYTHISYQWVDPASPNVRRYGPSILYQSDLITMSLDSATPPAPGSGRDNYGAPSAAGWANCSVNGGANPLYPVSDAASAVAAANSVFDPCVSNLGAHWPGNPAKVYGTSYGPSGTKPYTSWWQQYYNSAIASMDQFRQEYNTSAHVVGLGESAEWATNAGGTLIDPYQNEQDSSARHDIFGARMAGDTLRAIAEPQLPAGIREQPYPDFNYDGYDSWDTLAQGKRQGTYLATTDPNQLRFLFEEIGQEILLRLTE